ncbi:hypothetical protein C1H87_18720 [Flavivirga eckloniae]|uniref:Outer membrane protein beta-barrel domain-containing protein n=2 Tax=Flavivirga eckloniae TaxID=1803846 RepID=A0A2K9PUA7_9FLAO|nr:hypothetical protein C1H87_18720 [Flavivirga eckloniae]
MVSQEEDVLWEKNNYDVDDKDNGSNNWANWLTYKKMFSKHHENWSIKYTGFEDVDDDFIIPFTLSYEHNKIKAGILEGLGYKKADIFSLGFGFDGYLVMYPGVYLGLGVGVSPGMETITKINDSKNSRFYINGGLKQGLKIVPWPKLGIVLGVEFFQKLQRSKVYTSEIGWALELGINFK